MNPTARSYSKETRIEVTYRVDETLVVPLQSCTERVAVQEAALAEEDKSSQELRLCPSFLAPAIGDWVGSPHTTHLNIAQSARANKTEGEDCANPASPASRPSHHARGHSNEKGKFHHVMCITTTDEAIDTHRYCTVFSSSTTLTSSYKYTSSALARIVR